MKPCQHNYHDYLCPEIVLAQDEAARRIHKDLFSLHDACYFPFGTRITDSILAASRENITKLHVSAGWENMLKIALWTSETPLLFDVLSLIKKAGIHDEELLPFRKSELKDIFFMLYYGNRRDVLKRICRAAKKKAESIIVRKDILIYCHLVSDETGKIIASNL